MTINTWLGAKRFATKENYNVVYFDFDTQQYGATVKGCPEGHFENGRFVKHLVIYFPASWTAEKMEREFDDYVRNRLDIDQEQRENQECDF